VQHYAAFRPARQAKFLDFMEVHFYPLEHGFYEYADAASETKNLAYFESVVREVARTGKPVVIAEFGWYGGGKLTINNGKHPPAFEEQQARWCRRLVETSRPFASGWLNWGFYDHPEARDVTQLTGLLTADGKQKAWGKVFHELAPLVTAGGTRKLPERVDLPWNDCLTSMAAARKFRESYHDAFSAR
jgi:hypothetical protein